MNCVYVKVELVYLNLQNLNPRFMRLSLQPPRQSRPASQYSAPCINGGCYINVTCRDVHKLSLPSNSVSRSTAPRPCCRDNCSSPSPFYPFSPPFHVFYYPSFSRTSREPTLKQHSQWHPSSATQRARSSTPTPVNSQPTLRAMLLAPLAVFRLPRVRARRMLRRRAGSNRRGTPQSD